MFERLEQRRLLSVGTNFVHDLGLMEIFGTDKDDHISVEIEHALVKPINYHVDGPFDASPLASARELQDAPVESAQVSIYESGVLARRFVLPLATLRAVDLVGGLGDDVLSLSNHGTPIVTSIIGDLGNDVIDATNAMGAPGSFVSGGDGDDVIRLWSGRGAFEGHMAWGDGGHDLIYGSDRDDQIWGDDDGIRELWVEPGDDTVFGGAGDDKIWGGRGNDMLYGEAGNDFISGGGGADLIVGGDGDDTGEIDEHDKHAELENLILVKD